MRYQLAAVAIVALLAAVCGGQAPRQSSPSPTPAAGTHHGVAGLIPPNFPKPSDADCNALYTSIPETGGWLGVYTNWSDSDATAGAIPTTIDTAFGLAERYHFTPVPVLGTARDGPGASLVPTLNAANRAAFVKAASAVANKYRPEYLGLGVEVNRLDPAAFDEFVASYLAAYDTIKSTSPNTKVFTVFQLELMKGDAFLMTGKPVGKATWDLLTAFGDKLDVVGFTTYPFLDYQSPVELPDDYYAGAAARAGRPIVFTEVGWPSAPLSTAPTSGYGGTPEEQASFARRFLDLTQGVDVQLALWSFPNDIGVAWEPRLRIGCTSPE